MDQVLYGIDYIEYYFYWIYYKFIGYPLIIRICSIAVMFCIIAYLFLLFHIIYGIFKRRKEKRRYNRFFVKFGGNLFFISMVFLFFFLNPIKSCRYVCFLVTLKTPHH